MLFSSTVNASWQDWTSEQRQWFVAANLVTLADWATTRDMSRRYDQGYRELNPLLGRHPNTGRVDCHFAAGMILNYYITDWLQGDRRTVYLKIFTLSEAIIVGNNLNIGLEIKF